MRVQFKSKPVVIVQNKNKGVSDEFYQRLPLVIFLLLKMNV